MIKCVVRITFTDENSSLLELQAEIEKGVKELNVEPRFEGKGYKAEMISIEEVNKEKET